MSYYVAAELLVLALLLPLVLRCFFRSYAKIDNIVVIAPLAVLFACLSLFAFGVTLLGLATVLLSVYVFFLNFRALLRLWGGLVVDYYHPPFVVGSVIGVLLVLLVGAALAYYLPKEDVPLAISLPAKQTVATGREVLVGSAARGLEPKDRLFAKTGAVLYTVSPAPKSPETEAPAQKPVLLYVPSPLTAVRDGMPLLRELSSRGYTVLAADFALPETAFSRSSLENLATRGFMVRMGCILNPAAFQSNLPAYQQKTARNAQTLLRLAEARFPDRQLAFLCDISCQDDISAQSPGAVCVPLALDNAALLALTNPLEAELLNPERWRRAKKAEFAQLPEFLAIYVENCLLRGF